MRLPVLCRVLPPMGTPGHHVEVCCPTSAGHGCGQRTPEGPEQPQLWVGSARPRVNHTAIDARGKNVPMSVGNDQHKDEGPGDKPDGMQERNN